MVDYVCTHDGDLAAMSEGLPPCGGEGFVTCECGGDFCACHVVCDNCEGLGLCAEEER